jgi:hypothetical protein
MKIQLLAFQNPPSPGRGVSFFYAGKPCHFVLQADRLKLYADLSAHNTNGCI